MGGRRTTVIAVLALLGVAAALGVALALRSGSSLTSARRTQPTVSTSSTISPSATAIGPAADAAAAACAAELSTVRTAIQTYTAVNGTSPTDEASIVTAGLLDATTPNYDVAVVNGATTVVLRRGSPCAAP